MLILFVFAYWLFPLTKKVSQLVASEAPPNKHLKWPNSSTLGVRIWRISINAPFLLRSGFSMVRLLLTYAKRNFRDRTEDFWLAVLPINLRAQSFHTYNYCTFKIFNSVIFLLITHLWHDTLLTLYKHASIWIFYFLMQIGLLYLIIVKTQNTLHDSNSFATTHSI